MNTQYFTEIINELNRIAPYLTDYQAYVTRVLAAESLSCSQLADLALQAAAKLTQSSAQVVSISTKATNAVAAMQTNITNALAAIAPLLIAPTNLTELITWAAAMVNTFAGPQATLVAQETILVSQLALITTAVTNTTNAVNTIASDLTTAIQNARTGKGCV